MKVYVVAHVLKQYDPKVFFSPFKAAYYIQQSNNQNDQIQWQSSSQNNQLQWEFSFDKAEAYFGDQLAWWIKEVEVEDAL